MTDFSWFLLQQNLNAITVYMYTQNTPLRPNQSQLLTYLNIGLKLCCETVVLWVNCIIFKKQRPYLTQSNGSKALSFQTIVNSVRVIFTWVCIYAAEKELPKSHNITMRSNFPLELKMEFCGNWCKNQLQLHVSIYSMKTSTLVSNLLSINLSVYFICLLPVANLHNTTQHNTVQHNTTQYYFLWAFIFLINSSSWERKKKLSCIKCPL